jgi:hypothetical protein
LWRRFSGDRHMGIQVKLLFGVFQYMPG